MEQEDVNQVAEQTVATESSPVTETAPAVEQPAEAQTAPAEESLGTEKTVSEHVPYDRFAEVNAKAKALEERNAYLEAMQQQAQAQPVQSDIPELDEQSAMAVDHIVNKRLEERLSAEFERKNKDVLSDRLVKTAFEAVVREKMEKRVPYIDRDEALKEAQELIDSRLKKQQVQAKESGVEEGQKLAEQKQQLAPVGETGKFEEKSDDQLSAAEFAKKYGIPRTPGY